MLMHLRSGLLPLAAVSLVAACFCISLLHADDEKVFTQKPVVAPSQVHGSPVTPGAGGTKPEPKLFSKGPAPWWIWGADDNRRYFLRKEFQGGSTAARLRATCDNHTTIYLNAEEVRQSDVREEPVEVDGQKFLKPEKNVLRGKVTNDDGPAGFILKLALTTAKGETRYVVSDDTWEAAEKQDAERWVPARKIAKEG